ncbi:MAG: family 43 glycosylhydrolase [Brevundimonas sp.]|uniref:family 43 glycosylhydrolase n=1 Tax=Brevundimonas sp. TaxID=1871086 RepID=UPI00273715F4|nr:family 43 glycosylhydrolase [Brevundimonas sp.]MDP3406210.1 family 43 glycosylhydrolase [Brevundimonas sp.]
MQDPTRRSWVFGSLALAAPVGPSPLQPRSLDDSGRLIPTPVPNPYPYSGISGPGVAATAGSARGGWMSGLPGVRYSGAQTMPWPTLAWGEAATGSAVDRGLLPRIRPLLELHLRDTQICIGGDGAYYMTGSTGDNIWAFNDGIELWRSVDLVDWHYLGLVWSLDREGGWAARWRARRGVPFRAIWAPEVHYINDKYYLCFSVSRAGLGILRSTTGRPEGPYEYAFSPDAHLRRGIDASLFQDDDGAVWLTYGSADEIVRLKDDLSGYAGDWQRIAFEPTDCLVARDRARCLRGENTLGYEGATMFRKDGLYYLGAVGNVEGRYSFVFAVSETLHGPYRMRHEAAPCAGGGNVFRDRDGLWWSTFFGNDEQSHFREKPGLLRVDFDGDGRIVTSPDQPFALPAASETVT